MLVLIGDSIHNALDGVIIGAAFLTDVQLGIVTAIAVDGSRDSAGNRRFRGAAAFAACRAARALAAQSGDQPDIGGRAGVVAYFTLGDALRILPYAIAVPRPRFLYVAVADLIPGLHRRVSTRESMAQVILISLGIAVIAIVERHAH